MTFSLKVIILQTTSKFNLDKTIVVVVKYYNQVDSEPIMSVDSLQPRSDQNPISIAADIMGSLDKFPHMDPSAMQDLILLVGMNLDKFTALSQYYQVPPEIQATMLYFVYNYITRPTEVTAARKEFIQGLLQYMQDEGNTAEQRIKAVLAIARFILVRYIPSNTYYDMVEDISSIRREVLGDPRESAL